MAKVFTGRVVIPGDKMGEYLRLLAEAEKRKEPLRQSLLSLCREFQQFLEARYSERTARKHASVIELFIEFICRYTDVEKIEEITRGMVNTEFKRWWKRKVWDSTTPDEIRVALKKFFRFLAEEKSIVNEKALNALR